MINYIDCEKRLSAEEHFYLYVYYMEVNRMTVSYGNFHIYEELIDRYNSLPLVRKVNLESTVLAHPDYITFINSFNNSPWNYEKPVIWKDRSHTEYFIEQLESSHSFEVFIDKQFKARGVDIGLYYGRDLQYAGESEAGIEIKYDIKSRDTHNYYIEYQERMRNTGAWVDSGILKNDNTRFYLFGTMDEYVIFERQELVGYYDRLIGGEQIDGAVLVRERAHNTSKGFIIKPEIWRRISLSIDQVISRL